MWNKSLRAFARRCERSARLHPVLLVVGAAAALTIAACSPPVPTDSSLDDEAMQRFRKEERARTDGQARTPQQAAYEWFWPKYLDDYFHGMDGIVPESSPTVYQLLDHSQDPGHVDVRDPLEIDSAPYYPPGGSAQQYLLESRQREEPPGLRTQRLDDLDRRQ